MSEIRDILVEQVERLLADRTSPALLRAAEAGTWPEALWAEAEALGLPLAMVPEDQGGAGLGWADAAAVWHVLGRHAAPIPLGESMAAAALLSAAGIAAPAGFIGLGIGSEPVAWGRRASHLAVAPGGAVALHAPTGWQQGRGLIAREPADRPSLGPALTEGRLPAAHGPDAALLAGALLNAARIAGALEAVLDMTVDYANTRKQFGRAIGGFQAVQQLLARCAGEVAATAVAVTNAGRAADRRGLAGAEFEIASAKVVAGEAAGIAADIVHQVHAAIGFTDEHPLHLHTRRLWGWRDGAGPERLWASRIGTVALARGGSNLWADLTSRDEETAA
ncbi:acyl-CoA dehydrogenase family protein [Paeniroseomonas aquatica]|uniref:Acyl-CoA dehydrogenase family protein n=1 Tax=Paeniroseomonas aquatica TaxID=373043 RepID=A0ABT8AAI4_9PROT|nr:acyl-CoA dehydrogenase family protein [Paeniroseomonas aquatica]MDN3566533.1 acyl-CoA dehydrogenase family protein [Paeniroseomonas aquatica]